MYGLEHHMVEISGDVTDAGRTDVRTDEQGKIELLIQMEAGWLSFAIKEKNTFFLKWCIERGYFRLAGQ